jgi:5-methylcytosine-specific restriction enzyme A
MGMKQYTRYSAQVLRSKRWQRLRQQALRRDGYRCVAERDGRKCGAPAREVDHIKRVKTHPLLAYELSNLQSLCTPCHSRKTRIELGMAPEMSPDRAAWRDLLQGEIECSNP